MPLPMFTRDQIVGANGSTYTKALFLELADRDKEHVILTLRPFDHLGFPSLRRLYLEKCVDDPTEYNFAVDVFGDFKYWRDILRSPDVASAVEEWRETCAVERKSIAFRSLISEVRKGGRGAQQASKYLIEEPWLPRSKKAQEAKVETTRKAIDPFSADILRMSEHVK